MSDMNLNYGDMEAVAKALTSGHEEISSQLQQLKARVNALAESGFRTDIASPKFQEAYNEFNSGVVQTLEGMLEMSQFLTQFVANARGIDRP